jgi:hypothetical protein
MFYLVQLINTLLNLLEMCLQQMQILFNVGKLFALSPLTVDVKSISKNLGNVNVINAHNLGV